MVLAVVIGDLHFKKDTPTVSDLVIHKITEEIDKLKPDIVVLLGDVLDSFERIDMLTQNKAIKFIKSIANKGINVAVLIGNHDRPNATSFLTEDSPFYALKGFPNIHIADRVLDLKWEVGNNKEKVRFICVPYVQPKFFHEALDTLEIKVLDKDHPVSAIFCHQTFKGAKSGNYTHTASEADEWPDTNPLVICGHLHTFHQPQNNIVYVGTPNQQSINDSSEKGILVCEFAPGVNPAVNFLPLETRRKKMVKLKPTEVDTYVPPPNCDVQIDIEGTADEIAHLSKKGIISQMRSRGISVSLSTVRESNPKNPDNKSFKDLLLQMIMSDNGALDIFNEIFSNASGPHLSLAPTASLSDLMKSSQNVVATKISSDPNQLLNALMAQAKASGNVYGAPVPQASSQVQALFSGFGSSLTQTERAPNTHLSTTPQNPATNIAVNQTSVPSASSSAPQMMPPTQQNSEQRAKPIEWTVPAQPHDPASVKHPSSQTTSISTSNQNPNTSSSSTGSNPSPSNFNGSNSSPVNPNGSNSSPVNPNGSNSSPSNSNGSNSSTANSNGSNSNGSNSNGSNPNASNPNGSNPNASNYNGSNSSDSHLMAALNGSGQTMNPQNLIQHPSPVETSKTVALSDIFGQTPKHIQSTVLTSGSAPGTTSNQTNINMFGSSASSSPGQTPMTPIQNNSFLTGLGNSSSQSNPAQNPLTQIPLNHSSSTQTHSTQNHSTQSSSTQTPMGGLGLPTTPSALRMPGFGQPTSAQPTETSLFQTPSTPLLSQLATTNTFSPLTGQLPAQPTSMFGTPAAGLNFLGQPAGGSSASGSSGNATISIGRAQILTANPIPEPQLMGNDLMASLQKSSQDEKAKAAASNLANYLPK